MSAHVHGFIIMEMLTITRSITVSLQYLEKYVASILDLIVAEVQIPAILRVFCRQYKL